MICPTNNQRGVTMLLAILVLSAITAISFSLATIVFIEIRTSGDVMRTEPTLYASQAITEEALFKVKRSAPVMYTANLNGIVLDNPAPVEVPYSSSPLIVILKASTTKQYQMVNPDNLFNGGGYGKLVVTLVNAVGTSIDVSVDQINPVTGNRDAGYAGAHLTAASPTLTVLGCASSLTCISPTMQYELNIQNIDPVLSATVSIETYKADGTTPQGLPHVGQTVLDIVASYAGLTRKYEVKIPE
jgi:hypothetical protein